MVLKEKHFRASPVGLAVAALVMGLTLAACDRPTTTSTTSRTETTPPSNTASSNIGRTTPSAPAPSTRSPSTMPPSSMASSDTGGAAKGADDSAITSQVKTAIAADPNLKSQQISVETKNHTVRLAGNVETSAQRDRAKEIATGVTGVRGVVDELKVKAS